MFSLGSNNNVARTIVLVIDYSPSQFPFLDTSIAAAQTMIDKLGPLDRMAIVNDNVEMVQDFTTDKKKLKDKLESFRELIIGRAKDAWRDFSLRITGDKQYSALFATLNEAFDHEDQRPIVIFQTDGDQLGSLRLSPMDGLKSPYHSGIRKEYLTSFSLEDIYRVVERSRATIYTVVPGSRIIGLSRDEQIKQVKAVGEQRIRAFEMMGRKRPDYVHQENNRPEVIEWKRQSTVLMQTALVSVATVSGGWLKFLERPEQADEIYSQILSDINRRYLVGYYPTNKEHDGKRRNIAVTIRDYPDYQVVGRKWYYAPSPDQ
jgi:VWFA-related protein